MAQETGNAAYIVIAEFELKPGCTDAFLAVARDDAACSVRDEPGCRQFDVVLPDDAPGHVVFYEVYDSRAAFEQHLLTPHFARFAKAWPELAQRALPARFAARSFP